MSRNGNTLAGPVSRPTPVSGPSFDKLSKIWDEPGAAVLPTPGGGAGAGATALGPAGVQAGAMGLGTATGAAAGGAAAGAAAGAGAGAFNSAFASALFPVTPFHGFRSSPTLHGTTAGAPGGRAAPDGPPPFDAVAALLANSLPPIDQAVSLSFPALPPAHAPSAPYSTMPPTASASEPVAAHTTLAQRATTAPYGTHQTRSDAAAHVAAAPNHTTARLESAWPSTASRAPGTAGGNIWGTDALSSRPTGSLSAMSSSAWPGLDAQPTGGAQPSQPGKSLQSDMAMLQQMLPGVNLTYGEDKQQMQGSAGVQGQQQPLHASSQPIRVARP